MINLPASEKRGRVRCVFCRTAVLLLALTVPAAPLRAEFAPDDVHFWIGSGTNTAILVVDWNPTALAWGYRWNGTAPCLTDILETIATEDKRFHAFLSESTYGASLDGFAYDRNGNGGLFEMAQGSQTDPEDLFKRYAGDHYWVLTSGTGDAFSAVAWNCASVGADGFVPVPGEWIALRHINWRTYETPWPSEPAAAETPYAWRVVTADVDTGTGYGDVTAALGAPARANPYFDPVTWQPRADIESPVVPCDPAWQSSDVVTLATASDEDIGGSITLAFDHPVLDDPANPFGLDFIIFGNAFQLLGGNAYGSGMDDPATLVFSSASIVAEPGLVEVSQDGVVWHAFEAGPYANGFAPTLGRRYDPENPDTALWASEATLTNRWWGTWTDATLPVDPSIGPEAFVGKTLAEMARLYNGSAGGTGFDIGALPLEADEQGRKWIQYVRITALEPGDETEIDAVSDVTPAPSFDNWVRTHFAFDAVPTVRKSTACANGLPAALNAALGNAPDAAHAGAFAVEGFAFDATQRPVLTLPFAQNAWDLFVAERRETPGGAAVRLLPSPLGTDASGRARFALPAESADAQSAFFRIVLPDDAEE